MNKRGADSPLSAGQVTDLHFLEHRAKLIDIAAFLDRVGRASRGADAADEDFRLVQFREALNVLTDGQDQRAKRVLETFSDPTNEPIASAEGMKGASGAWPGARLANEVSS